MIIEMRMPPQGSGIRISVVGMGSGQRLGEKERSIVRLIAIMAPNVIMYYDLAGGPSPEIVKMMLTVAPAAIAFMGELPDMPALSSGPVHEPDMAAMAAIAMTSSAAFTA